MKVFGVHEKAATQEELSLWQRIALKKLLKLIAMTVIMIGNGMSTMKAKYITRITSQKDGENTRS